MKGAPGSNYSYEEKGDRGFMIDSFFYVMITIFFRKSGEVFLFLFFFFFCTRGLIERGKEAKPDDRRNGLVTMGWRRGLAS